MNIANDPAALSLAADAQGLEALRLRAKNDPRGAMRETARQFESLLLNVMMKSMRETVGKDNVFDSDQTRMYTSLMDQQLAELMSRRGVGLAEMLTRQLSPTLEAPQSPLVAVPGVTQAVDASPPQVRGPETSSAPRKVNPTLQPHVRQFVEHLGPAAEAASRETGIPARFLLGHAALETGWGRHEIRGADGSQSFNLFGIKADASWQGRTVHAVTTEYVNGQPKEKVEAFRAYSSYQDAFRDYAQLLGSRPRYADVLKNTHDAKAYARELQEAGYATDPRFARKLAGVIDGASLRLSLQA